MKNLVRIGALTLVLGLAACTEERYAGVPDDTTIVSNVEDELLNARVAGNIEVQAQSGVVTLSGNVPSTQEKERAEDAAEQVAGVTTVVNNLRTTMAGDAPPAIPENATDLPPAVPPAVNPPQGGPQM